MSTGVDPSEDLRQSLVVLRREWWVEMWSMRWLDLGNGVWRFRRFVVLIEAAKGRSWSASIIGPLNYLDWGERQHHGQDWPSPSFCSWKFTKHQDACRPPDRPIAGRIFISNRLFGGRRCCMPAVRALDWEVPAAGMALWLCWSLQCDEQQWQSDCRKRCKPWALCKSLCPSRSWSWRFRPVQTFRRTREMNLVEGGLMLKSEVKRCLAYSILMILLDVPVLTPNFLICLCTQSDRPPTIVRTTNHVGPACGSPQWLRDIILLPHLILLLAKVHEVPFQNAVAAPRWAPRRIQSQSPRDGSLNENKRTTR